MLKLLDKLVDFIIKILTKYKNKRKIQKFKKKDPFIYN